MIQKLKEVISLTAAYYGHDLSDEVLAMYAKDLSDLDPKACIRAYDSWRKIPGKTRMPLPAEIRDMLTPKLSDEDVAKDVAARILSAIPKFGHPNRAEAMAYVGELGERVIDSLGGWDYLCKNHNSRNDSIFMSQVRELTKTIKAKNDLGMDDYLPGLKSSRESEHLLADKKELEQNQRDLAKVVKELSQELDR